MSSGMRELIAKLRNIANALSVNDPRSYAHRVALNGCADELEAALIAELGQGVGAVAPVSFAVELADGTLGALGWIDYAKFEHVKNMGTLANGARYVFAYRTSTSHTSEARDAVSVDVREMKTSAGRDYYVCVQVGDRYLTPNMYREKWKADFDAAEWTALFNGTARPDILSFMPEDAAMRQEGGSDA